MAKAMSARQIANIVVPHLKKEFGMGYRSNVAYLILFDDKEVYDQFRVQYKLDDAYLLCREDERNPSTSNVTLEFDEENHAIKFNAYDVKWYDDFDDVKCHEALLKLADEYGEKYKGVSWAFVRIGEEQGDVETKDGYSESIRSAQDYLYPVSSIQFDM